MWHDTLDQPQIALYIILILRDIDEQGASVLRAIYMALISFEGVSYDMLYTLRE
jgi:hypothetical protein